METGGGANPGLGGVEPGSSEFIDPSHPIPSSGVQRRRVISVPDRIAWLRIALVAPVMALVLADGRFDGAYGWAAAVFAVAAASDFFDGYLARRWELTTTLGAFLDSIADKVLVTGTLFALVGVHRAWPWAGFLIVGRELAVMGLRAIAAIRGDVVPPSSLGKLKAVVQFLAMFLAILRTPDRWAGLFPDEWVMLGAVVLTVVSAIDYFGRYVAAVRRA